MMDEKQLEIAIARGEDSRRQFKRNFNNAEALAAELIAFANSEGGQLFIGVDDDGTISGLSRHELSRLNQLLSNAASQNVHPPVNPISENILTENGLVIVVSVEAGMNKPYMDAHGRIWVKNGADKRTVASREEMQRLFQASGLLYADETAVNLATLDDIDAEKLAGYFERRYHQSIEKVGLPLPQILRNLNLSRGEMPNLAGLLLFGKSPQTFKPAFMVKAAFFPETSMIDNHYLDKEEIDGTLSQQYDRGMAFITRNLRHVQSAPSFNSLPKLEIPETVFEEFLVNALVHRDYFVNAPIRLFVFSDRVELISPGCLPNHLDPEHIRYGISNLRNSVLASHAFYLLPYSGLGSGIPRAIAAWPDIDLVNDREKNQFQVIIHRKLVT
jgi:predicted HTH transcriptional regulator